MAMTKETKVTATDTVVAASIIMTMKMIINTHTAMDRPMDLATARTEAVMVAPNMDQVLVLDMGRAMEAPDMAPEVQATVITMVTVVPATAVQTTEALATEVRDQAMEDRDLPTEDRDPAMEDLDPATEEVQAMVVRTEAHTKSQNLIPVTILGSPSNLDLAKATIHLLT
jgi:hypothetical protein